ncbi:hydantoinase subunit beta [Chlorella sorokiniana]|uniref:Hydantoinase subunit beta n=1 Tax=Chlorella sorokiniana TaxID=3076 RepID=A0A2P6TQV8_CHLSO|nr:hydantoinase subunit beta [Chlorella sorokiniana]|eukprot:PRW56447.1 hydantoinase subunit beta [Chlorella sorokiniana]
MSLRIGIDCGGTNTDAVVLDASDRVLGWAKRTTTEPDVLAGVQQAVTAALRGAGRGPEEVAAVMLGTTQFVNACVQLRGLSPVAVVRLCGPATHSLPPFCDMPPALRQAVGGAYFLADGGLEFDGCSEIAPLHERQLRGIARRILAAGIRCVVVAGVFAPVQAAQEQRAAAILLDEAAVAAAEAAAGLQGGGGGKADDAAAAGPAGGISEPALLVCLSHEIGQLGLLERENAAILNAALLPLARRVVPACEAALSAAGIAAPLLFCSNDGTLLPAAAALKLPVATFQSGPVNSLRGAALLTGLKHAAVIDIGGTTTDVGLLVGGLPRPAPRVTLLAGAPTNFQMPDVLSIGLGGGSLLRFPAAPAAGTLNQAAGMQEDLSVRCSVGPDSVGAALEQQALCFGGPTATASDAAALLGRMQLGSRQAVAAGLSGEQAQAAWEQMQRLFEGALDRAKTEAGDLPVIVVGGGAPLCGDGLAALGAGILGCGGGGSPSKALLKAVMELQRTEPGGMRVVSLSSLSNDALVADCGYMGAPTVSLEKLDSTHTAEAAVQASLDAYGAELAASAASAAGPSSTAGAAGPSGPSSGAGGSAPSPAAAPPPNLTALLSFEMGGGNGLEPLVVGAGSRMGLPVVDADLMGRAFPEMQMTTAAIYGAPILPTALADEKGNAVVVHRAASPAWLERLLRPVCTEMGCSAGCSDCPLTGQQLKRVAVPRSLSLAWHLGSAVAQAQHAKRDAAEAIADAGGGRVLFRGKVIDVQRSTTAGFARGTLLLERGSGGSNRGAGDFSSSASGRSGGSRSSGGDGGGSAVVSSPKQRLRIHFQNENLVAEELGADEAQAGQAGGQWATAHHPAALPAAATAEASSSRDGSSGGGSSGARVLATVPDLICCIEEDTGQPIATEEMRYGLRAAVVGLPAHPLLTTTQALAVVGPAAFGHGEVAYVPLGRYAEPSSIPR